jgi:SAM-dependent methyltransferase
VTPDPGTRPDQNPAPPFTVPGGTADLVDAQDEAGAGWLSVWATAQTDARTQRRGRYGRASTAHPAKMLPAIAAHAIRAYTAPGDLVLDPMCGIGTTLVEAVHAGRHGLGVEYEASWARLATANLDLASRQGATGHGHVVTGDARHLPRLHAGLPDTLPEVLRGRAALVITSPPYGRHVHGQVTARPGHGVTKRDYRYAPTRRGSGNLAHTSTDRLLAGFTTILTTTAHLLRPGGHVVVTARPWRDHGRLVDLPTAVLDAGRAAGLVPVERCVALLAGLRGAGLVPRASFFQLTAVRNARDVGTPLHVIAHEDVYVFTTGRPENPAISHRTGPDPVSPPDHDPATTATTAVPWQPPAAA